MAEPLLPERRWSVRPPLASWPGVAFLVLLLGALWGYFELRALGDFQRAWVGAHRARDVAALSALVCWDDVSAEERQRMRLLLAQEMEHPLKTSKLELAFGAQASPGWRANRIVVARLTIVYDTPERLTVSFPIGLQGFFGHRLAMMVPEK